MTVMVPVRGDGPVFGAAAKPTVPAPEPAPPLVIESHAVLVDADQLHSLPVVTVKLVDPPLDPTVLLVGLTLAEQVVLLCWTVIVTPAAVSEPVRAAPPVLAATV